MFTVQPKWYTNCFVYQLMTRLSFVINLKTTLHSKYIITYEILNKKKLLSEGSIWEMKNSNSLQNRVLGRSAKKKMWHLQKVKPSQKIILKKIQMAFYAYLLYYNILSSQFTLARTLLWLWLEWLLTSLTKYDYKISKLCDDEIHLTHSINV